MHQEQKWTEQTEKGTTIKTDRKKILQNSMYIEMSSASSARDSNTTQKTVWYIFFFFRPRVYVFSLFTGRRTIIARPIQTKKTHRSTHVAGDAVEVDERGVPGHNLRTVVAWETQAKSTTTHKKSTEVSRGDEDKGATTVRKHRRGQG